MVILKLNKSQIPTLLFGGVLVLYLLIDVFPSSDILVYIFNGWSILLFFWVIKKSVSLYFHSAPKED